MYIYRIKHIIFKVQIIHAYTVPMCLQTYTIKWQPFCLFWIWK